MHEEEDYEALLRVEVCTEYREEENMYVLNAGVP